MSETERNTTRIIVVVTVCVVLGAATLYAAYLKDADPDRPDIDGLIFGEPESINRFSLVTDETTPFSPRDFNGEWNLVFFGFTNCPHICPAHMAKLAIAYREFTQSRGIDTPMPKIYFVTVDPDRDNPGQVKRFLKSFNPEFVGLTGEAGQLERLRDSLNATRQIQKAKGLPDDYNVNHSALLHLIDPRGRYAAYFEPPFSPDTLLRDFAAVADYLEEQG